MTKLTQAERKIVVDGLILNCADCGWTEDDRGVLNSMSDRTLAVMANQARFVNNGELVINAPIMSDTGLPRYFADEDSDMVPPPTLVTNSQQGEPELLRPCGCRGGDSEMAPPVINFAAQAAGTVALPQQAIRSSGPNCRFQRAGRGE